MTALLVEGLSRSFGAVHAVQDVSLSIAPGERHVIIGPNGAGKTTLFNLISGAIAPSAGRVRLFGRDISRLPDYQRAHAGLARTFQISTLFRSLSVLEHALLALQATEAMRFVLHRPLVAYRPLYARAERLLDQWGLWDRRNVPAASLAYGDQRLVEIVMALAREPRVLLLDEPTAGLSMADTRRVAEHLSTLSRDMAIVMIEHDMDVAFAFAERTTVLHQGRVLAVGTPAAIRADERVNAVYLGTDRVQP